MTNRTCATCKWCVEPGHAASCDAPQNNDGPPTGFDARRRWQFCSTHREDGFFASLLTRTCGRRGRWWQPKEAT